MVIKTIKENIAYYCRDLLPDESVQLIFEKVKNNKYNVLLESSNEYTQKTSEFSIISALPEMLLTIRNSQLTLKNLNDQLDFSRKIQLKSIDHLKLLFSELLDPLSEKENIDELSHLPFLGGFLGFISYDFVRYIEKLPEENMPEYTPDLQFILTNSVVIIDHKESKLWVISDNEVNLNYLIHRISLNIKEEQIKNQFRLQGERKISFSEDKFVDIVNKTKEYISEGEIYQANISIRFSQFVDMEPYMFYKNLYKTNPSPFCSFVMFDDICIVCNSPERLVKSYPYKRIETRPIAGTRGRGKDPGDDIRLEIELLESAKECSEHIMLVDLERNDLGKVAKYNTVYVDELYTVERYSHVMHLVSNVSAIMDDNYDCFDLIFAMFPGGTITGVPKVRCMQIIEELEPVRRGVYTGSIGYMDYRGSLDFNIVIRTVLLERAISGKHLLKMQFGAGIVADSVPKHEYKECIKKGRAIFDLLDK